MAFKRLIARLDIKGPKLIKGVRLEGFRVVGDPEERARLYYEQGADELLYIDAVASLYGRNSLQSLVQRTASEVFVPITVGGGVRSIDDVKKLLRSGADKVAINTAAVRRPDLLTEIAKRFGSQCLVVSIQAKRSGSGRWEVYTDGGREHSGRDVVEWVRAAQDLGAGEILLTSIDRDGTLQGFDTELVGAVAAEARIPLIVSGGMSSIPDVRQVLELKADAIAVASALHYDKLTIGEIRDGMAGSDVALRWFEPFHLHSSANREDLGG